MGFIATQLINSNLKVTKFKLFQFVKLLKKKNINPMRTPLLRISRKNAPNFRNVKYKLS